MRCERCSEPCSWLQEAKTAAQEDRQRRKRAEERSATVQADGSRRASSFQAAVQSAVAQAQQELLQERDKHESKVHFVVFPLPFRSEHGCTLAK